MKSSNLACISAKNEINSERRISLSIWYFVIYDRTSAIPRIGKEKKGTNDIPDTSPTCAYTRNALLAEVNSVSGDGFATSRSSLMRI